MTRGDERGDTELEFEPFLDGRRFNDQRGAKIRGTIANVALARPLSTTKA
jgi:hypothetical protein